MKEILFNLALIDSLTFCKAQGIDPSGSHLVKSPRGYTYTLIRTETGRMIVATTFHRSSVPTHLIYRD